MSKILLVDDDIELTDLLAEVLRLTGFEVEVANNGQEALDKLECKPPVSFIRYYDACIKRH